MIGTDLLLRFSGPVGIGDCWKLMQNERWMLRVDFFSFHTNKPLIKTFYVYIVVTSNNLKLS